MRSLIFVVLLCAAVFSSSIYADEIYFKNGDRLTGKIDTLVNGKLILKTDFAGSVTIDLANIKTLSSSEPIEVHLKDGTVIHQKISRSRDDNFTVEETHKLKACQFNILDINSINPPPKPKPKWEGDFVAGLAASRGNTSNDNFTASFNLRKRTENSRTTLTGAYAKSKEKDPQTGKKDTTENWWRINGIYDYFVTKKAFGFVNGGYEKDSIAELDRRVILGGGLGYQWIESKKMNFATRGGLASVYEKYSNHTNSSSRLSAQLGYNFDMKLKENIKFIHNLTYYPGLERFSDYFLTSSAEIRTDLTKKMFTNFRVLFDYDATPATSASSTDIKYIAGVGVAF
jgi:putative salt-induced outer membrane protein YdiY